MDPKAPTANFGFPFMTWHVPTCRHGDMIETHKIWQGTLYDDIVPTGILQFTTLPSA